MNSWLEGRTDGWLPVDWIGRSQSNGEGVGGAKTHIGGTIKKIDGHFLDRQTASQPRKQMDRLWNGRTDIQT